MTRKERRNMEKKLGITAYHKTLSINKRFEIIRQNIIDGKKKQLNKKEEIRIEQNQKEDAELNNKVSSRALDLMIKEGMDYYSATEKAREELGVTK